MLFKRTTIPPEGRNKYGNYISTGNITKSIVSYNNGGNGTATGGTPSTPSTGTTEPQKNYALVLGKTQGNFEWDDIVANSGQTDTIQVLGYGDLVMVPTFVGDISIRPIEYNADGTPKLDANGNEILDETNVASNRNWDIKGIPESGVSVTVKNNGTSATTVEIKIDTNINTNQASLYIPCSVYTGDEDKAPWADNYNEDGGLIETEADDYSDWSTSDNTRTLWLEYNLSVLMNATNSYTLDLTNEIAGINWNNDSDTMMEGANLPTCQASLYFGDTKVENASYGLSIPANRGVVGVSINTNTGELTFGNNFYFMGTMLELGVTATDKSFTATKIMTINKIFPGKDGAGAINRWIVPSVNQITYNPNIENGLSNTSITAKVMKQVNAEPPVEDTETTIYWGWDTEVPSVVYSGPIAIEAGHEYLALALKNGNSDIYEIETIPIINEGINGEIGESVYTLILTNQNASINCDADGNILTATTYPTCLAYLYYGKTLQENITFRAVCPDSSNGVRMQGNRLILTPGLFYFNGISTTINISAYNETNILMGTQTMYISKNIPGKNGEDGAPGAPAVRYWLDLETYVFVVDASGNPNTQIIRVAAKKQVGAEEPTILSIGEDCTVLYGKNTFVPSLEYDGGIEYEEDASFYTVNLYDSAGDILYDSQTIPVVKDGKNGSNGSDGRQGPTIRGPFDYVNMTPVDGWRWCNGTLTSVEHPEDAEFIDIIMVDNEYYRCITSNTSDVRDWERDNIEMFLETFWEKADASYNFVATNLLLANNAKIKFASANELLLTDDEGNVTAGAAGTTSASTVNFWAGAADPANALFTVNNRGVMNAKAGSFGTLTIAEDELTGDGVIRAYGAPHDEDDASMYMQMNGKKITLRRIPETTGIDEEVISLSLTNADAGGNDSAAIEIYTHGKKALYTESLIEAPDITWDDNTTHAMKFGVWSPFNGFTIVPMTDDISLFGEAYDDSGVLMHTFNGVIINPYSPYTASNYPTIKIDSSTGYWVMSDGYNNMPTGIASSAAKREGNKLYIQL